MIYAIDSQTTFSLNGHMATPQKIISARYRDKHRARLRIEWRREMAERISLMSPEELAEFKENKRLYDLAYREKNKLKRAAYKADPERRKKWAAMRKAKKVYKVRVFLTAEEKEKRKIESTAKHRRDHPNELKEYYQANRDKLLAQKREYYLKNKDSIIKKNTARMAKLHKISPQARAISSCYTRVSRILRDDVKSKRTMELIGCSRMELLNHLESQFHSGMNWENYGRGGWHVDHIEPCAKFDMSDPAQQKLCFNYKNLQPMWAIDNIKKGSTHNGVKRYRKKPHTACHQPSTMQP